MAQITSRIRLLNNSIIAAATSALVLTLCQPAKAADTAPPASTGNSTDINAASVNARLLWLRAEIARHNDLYFKQNTAEISDAAYDALKRELKSVEQTSARTELSRQAKPNPFGDDRNGEFPVAVHRQPMLSLEKTYTETELRKFISRIEQASGKSHLAWVIEPKFDGLAINVSYENGQLIRAATRGDGKQGDDVTANVCTIEDLPRTLPANFPEFVELRGEVFIDNAEFTRINTEREEAGLEGFSNPRNLAAGTLKQHDPQEVAKRHLRIVFYGLGAWDGMPAAPTSQQALHQLIKAWNLPGVETFTIAHSTNDVWKAVARFGQQRASLGFPTDGAVVKVDDIEIQRELGASDEAPRWAVAYKFTPERVLTLLKSIHLQVGRTGMITPVAELAPVISGGTTITRASLYNAEAISRRDLRIGDWVYVEKAGEVIPVVVGPDTARRSANATPFVFPVACPACGEFLIRQENEATTWCVNRDCIGQLQRRIEHYASAEVASIKGLGTSMITALVSSRKIKTIADIYRLQRREIMEIGEVSEASAGALLKQIEQSKNIRLGRLIYGLSIPGIGQTTAREFAAKFTDLSRFAAVQRADLGDSDSFTADAVVEFFGHPENRRLIADLQELGVNPKSESSLRLSGKTLVLTGTLPTLSRAETTQRIESAGGRVSPPLSHKTDWLVAGLRTGGKLDEAKKLGIPIIDEAELFRLLAP